MLEILKSGLIGVIIGIIFPLIISKTVFHFKKRKKEEPFYQIKLWKNIVEFQLIIFSLSVIIFLTLICLLFILEGGEHLMDILIQIGVGVVTGILTSVAVTLIAYFKFLKHIPEEIEKKIDTLLNVRLGHEATNHNAVLDKGDLIRKELLDSLKPDNSQLSLDHREIQKILGSIEKHQIKNEANYGLLDNQQRTVVDSIKNLNQLSKIIQDLNAKNIQLEKEIDQLKSEAKTKDMELKQTLEKCQNSVKKKMEPYQSEDYEHGYSDDYER